mmetsp:Transcript_91041/g.278683  ORF Transcript_91041/g.278683 Transcript_91041/m.278683 type:complete len:86 (-) Transcript_91041:938-1195(-)
MAKMRTPLMIVLSALAQMANTSLQSSLVTLVVALAHAVPLCFHSHHNAISVSQEFSRTRVRKPGVLAEALAELLLRLKVNELLQS